MEENKIEESQVEQIQVEDVFNNDKKAKRAKWWFKRKRKKEKNSTAHSEAMRILVNTIDKCIKEGDNCLAFTSYLDQQGKTYTIQELGKTLAKAGYKTLIVDCNITMPWLSGGEKNSQIEETKGFLDIIDSIREKNNQITYNEISLYIRSEGLENLYFIPSRQCSSNDYTNYVRKEDLESIFHILKDKFEVVLVEAPSFQYLSYTQNILEASDGYLILIKPGTIEKKHIRHIKEKMSQITTQSIGVVFNKSDTQ